MGAHMGTALAGLALAASLLLAPVAPALGAPASSDISGDAASSLHEREASARLDAARSAAAERTYPDELGAGLGFMPEGMDGTSARRVTISRLASADTALDGQLVSFSGEVVGEPVWLADGNAWVQVQSASGGSFIMVAMRPEDAALIERVGGYQSKGTTLRITGVYRVADPNQLGDIDVTAYSVSVVDPGEERVEPVNFKMLGLALAFVAASAVLLVVARLVRRRAS